MFNPNTAPGANGKVVYARSPYLEWPNRLWTVNATGSGATQFTTNSVGTGDSWPEWSPGGTLIAFSRDLTASEVDGGNEIFTIHADKSGLKRLTTNNAHDVSPAFSPDGSRIVFMSIRDGNSELYTMNIDGSNVRRITNNAAYDSQADWSPDGTKIAFASDRAGGADIYTIKPDGTGLKRLTPWAGDDFGPSWSPDGSVIATPPIASTARTTSSRWTRMAVRSPGSTRTRASSRSGRHGHRTGRRSRSTATRRMGMPTCTSSSPTGASPVHPPLRSRGTMSTGRELAADPGLPACLRPALDVQE